MIPKRFKIIKPYLASFIHQNFERPKVNEVMNWLKQPSKEKRAMRWMKNYDQKDEFIEILFNGSKEKFYYPSSSDWLNLCQTIDEIFNEKNWHYYFSDELKLEKEDVVVDCGAAEGLFAFQIAPMVKKVYAIEPVPIWHPAMEKSFSPFENVELFKVGVGHKNDVLNMTNDGMSSQIQKGGELEITVKTLDSLFKDVPVSFIKADIEGYEFPMLLGAEETIKQNRPKLALTTYHDPNNFIEIKDFLRNIHSDYTFKLKGLAENGNPVLLQAY